MKIVFHNQKEESCANVNFRNVGCRKLHHEHHDRIIQFTINVIAPFILLIKQAHIEMHRNDSNPKSSSLK